jgi:SNF2 family DNA or RNA helicase
MRGPPLDEQFAESPLCIYGVGLSLNDALNDALTAKSAGLAGRPEARLDVEEQWRRAVDEKDEDEKAEIRRRINDLRESLDRVHEAQFSYECPSFSPPTLVSLCLQAVRDEPALHAAVASWDLALRLKQVDKVSVLLENMHEQLGYDCTEILQRHIAEYRQLRGRLFVPYTINRYLHGYQRAGVRFLAELFLGRRHAPGEQIKGGILADEMGLGKTIQVIGKWR